MVQFNGAYKLERSDNMEEFLAKMNVGYLKRKLALSMKPTVEVKVEGNRWRLVTHTPASTLTWSFTLGQEVTLTSSQGGETKAIFTLEGEKLIQSNLKGAEENVDIVRQFTGDEILMKLTHKPSGVQCTRVFKRK
ncbi:fatty acid-binding protein homolog 5-like [Eriocheir sinensis]|uniref:fatty acid-binding protein homolog 5-like n=1 Tax=Eriocheir sinensis TaxID=95602 RepID=UPI0021CA111F|nr:fatty acid-binding protein homolog 5-like [Eriocheir sinensis]